ncbi:MAG: hypothetical protein K1X88_22170 [Nannocystaceae bacterium]|nr:hypothetical protein [Nannocystaceae bacterium]
MLARRAVTTLALASLVANACGFDSGGVPGGVGASIGSGHGDSTDAGDNDGSGLDASAEGSASAADTTGNGMMTTSASTTNATGETTDGSGPGGESSSGTPPSPTSSGSGDGPGSSSGDAPPDPFYGDCSDSADCGGADCYVGQTETGTANTCLIPCDDGQCPPPPDGNTTPICTTNDVCVLDCAPKDAQCPTGMSCYVITGNDTVFFRCLWTH